MIASVLMIVFNPIASIDFSAIARLGELHEAAGSGVVNKLQFSNGYGDGTGLFDHRLHRFEFRNETNQDHVEEYRIRYGVMTALACLDAKARY